MARLSKVPLTETALPIAATAFAVVLLIVAVCPNAKTFSSTDELSTTASSPTITRFPFTLLVSTLDCRPITIKSLSVSAFEISELRPLRILFAPMMGKLPSLSMKVSMILSNLDDSFGADPFDDAVEVDSFEDALLEAVFSDGLFEGASFDDALELDSFEDALLEAASFEAALLEAASFETAFFEDAPLEAASFEAASFEDALELDAFDDELEADSAEGDLDEAELDSAANESAGPVNAAHANAMSSTVNAISFGSLVIADLVSMFSSWSSWQRPSCRRLLRIADAHW